MERNFRIMFAGGGTGGHLFPGIAVAECWQEVHPETEMIFVGSGRHVECEILNQTPYQTEKITIPSSADLRSPWRMLKNIRLSLQQTSKLIRDFKPNLVIGLGGASSVPTVLMATRMKIPTMLLEQNLVPGRATSLLARWVDLICSSFVETEDYLSNRAHVIQTGNPLRKQITNLQMIRHPRKKLVILGGSQGASIINQLMIDFLKHQPDCLAGWQVMHQSGSQDVETLNESYQRANLSAVVRPFFHDAAELYQQAGLAICRAGATTLAELSALNIPMITIPIPTSIRNHQVLNAKWYQDNGHSELVDQLNDFTATFQNFQTCLTKQLASYSSNSQLVYAQYQPPAVNRVISAIYDLCEHHPNLRKPTDFSQHSSLAS